MQCKQCNVEMFVMARNKNEVVYQCPKCKSISNVSVEEERKSLEEQKENENAE